MYQGVVQVQISAQNPDEMREFFRDHIYAYAHTAYRQIQALGLPRLYDTDVQWKRTHPFVTPVCDGDVCEKPERVDLWRDAASVYDEGEGDCKDLVAIRLAERWLAGDYDAEPIVDRYPDALGPGYDLFHARLRHGDGTVEDPSENRGMQGVG